MVTRSTGTADALDASAVVAFLDAIGYEGSDRAAIVAAFGTVAADDTAAAVLPGRTRVPRSRFRGRVAALDAADALDAARRAFVAPSYAAVRVTVRPTADGAWYARGSYRPERPASAGIGAILSHAACAASGCGHDRDDDHGPDGACLVWGCGAADCLTGTKRAGRRK